MRCHLCCCSQLPAVVDYCLGIGKLQLMDVETHYMVLCIILGVAIVHVFVVRCVGNCRVVVVAVVYYCFGIGKMQSIGIQINH